MMSLLENFLMMFSGKKKNNQLTTYTFLLKKNFSQKFHELGGGEMLFPNNSNIYYTADRAII